MRLLETETKDGYTFNKFDDHDVPPYAILSHTWEKAQEVTFDDIIEDKKRRSRKARACLHRLHLCPLKKGYDKLRFCARQAARDGLRYFWVDTCCINKTDETETQESINAMFRWYQNAAKCYVYLSDVSSGSQRRNARPSAWIPAFVKSRWFTRGWTLQELLAPSQVEFFSKEGVYLGSRLDLKQHIYDITNIPPTALSGAPLADFSVDERLSWAVGRQTTKKEDEVYCLLGMFGIDLPFQYGEQYEGALRRLLKAIDRSQATSIGEAKRMLKSTLPFSRDKDFVNRNSLSVVNRILAQPAARAALVGLGGVGKSQIAIEYAHQALDRSPKTWLFWVHAETQARFNQGYRDIAEKAKIIGYDDPKADIMRLVSTWLCNESNGRWAMVVDNADDASVFFRGTPGSSETEKADSATVQLPYADYLPQTSNGSILFTSRSRDVAYMLTGSEASIVEVGPMDEHESYGLLERKFTSAVKKNEADTLSESLDHMPLALTQAAAFINRTPRMSIPKYLRELDHNRARLLNEGLVDIRRDDEASNSIMTTWQISFEHIRNRSAAAARLLSLMSFFDRQGIPKPLLLGKYGGPQDEASTFEEDCRMLMNFSLIKPKADRSDFEMHSLVQYAMKKWLTLHDATEFEYWREAYVTLMDQSYPIGHPENWSVCQALLPHAQAALDNLSSDADALEHWASISWKAAWYMGEMGEYDRAYKLAIDSYDVRTILLGPDDPDTLDSLNTVGVALSRLGRYNEAEAMYQKAVEGKVRTLGAEHLDTLTSMLNLAIVYNSQGHWTDAEKLLKQVLKVAREKDWEAGRSLTLSTLTTLATTHSNLGRYADAADSEFQILKSREAQLGPEHPTTLTVKGNLAYTYKLQGRLKEAEKLNVQILKAHESNCHAETEILATKSHLASVYVAQGRWTEAEELQHLVLTNTTAKLGPNHPDTLYAMGNLAGNYWIQSRFSEAEELQLQLLELRKATLGDQHPSTLDVKASLATTYWSQDRFGESERITLEVLQIHKEKLGDEHPLTLDSKAALASVLRDQGRLEDAAVLEVEVLNARKEKLGAEHPNTLATMGNLAVTMRRQGRIVEAYELMCECHKGHMKILGPEHPLSMRYTEGLEKWRNEDGLSDDVRLLLDCNKLHEQISM